MKKIFGPYQVPTKKLQSQSCCWLVLQHVIACMSDIWRRINGKKLRMYYVNVFMCNYYATKKAKQINCLLITDRKYNQNSFCKVISSSHVQLTSAISMDNKTVVKTCSNYHIQNHFFFIRFTLTQHDLDFHSIFSIERHLLTEDGMSDSWVSSHIWRRKSTQFVYSPQIYVLTAESQTN